MSTAAEACARASAELIDLRPALLTQLRRNKIAEAAIAVIFTPGLCELHAEAVSCGLRLSQGQLVAWLSTTKSTSPTRTDWLS